MAALNPFYLLAGIFAFNTDYNNMIQSENGISKTLMMENILSKSPHPTLENARIRQDHLHGDSLRLSRAFSEMHLLYGILKRWVPEGTYTWDSVHSPVEYFDDIIKPRLSDEQVKSLEEFAKSLN